MREPFVLFVYPHLFLIIAHRYNKSKDMPKKYFLARAKSFFKKLGPGVITGAADDDPSGITTYSLVGARAGFSLLWLSILSFPLMAAIQEMCARIGIVTSAGLAGVMRKHYSRLILFLLAFLVIFANTINIGADLAGMAAVTSLILPLDASFWSVVYAALIIALMVFFPYRLIAKYLKWLTFSLFAYIFAAILAKPDWGAVLEAAFVPTITFDQDFITLVVAILGTTISPYLFFWQASEEVEERRENSAFRFEKRIVTKHELRTMREDVTLGMFISNLVMFFIMVNTATVFHARGIFDLSTTEQIASSLEPFVGGGAKLFFALGIVGTGFLAIPVLAGASAYVFAEALGYREGLSRPFQEAKAFYGVIIFSTAIGLIMSFLGLGVVEMLLGTAIIYGVVSPPLIAIIMHIANNKKIMGAKVNGTISNLLGFITLFIMAAVSVSFFYYILR